MLRAWRWWELIACVVWPPYPIPGAEQGVFRLRFVRYNGMPLELSDETRVSRGDHVGELHIWNRALVGATAGGKWSALIRMRADLAALADWTLHPDFPADVRAFYGVSMLSRGSEILGFTVRTRPASIRTQLERMYMAGLLRIYTSEGVARLSRGGPRNQHPNEVWMSRGELLRRYGA